MKLKLNHIEFQKEIEERGIQYLVHFTPTINLFSIFTQGKILSRAILERMGIQHYDILDAIQFTDNVRYDNKNYINLSIQRPNFKLFNRFRQNTAFMNHIFWCVLLIDTKYIYSSETLFSITNAANSFNKKDISGEITTFRKMFDEEIEIVTSYDKKIFKRVDLKPCYTTDQQAEVLVKDEIPIDDILKICFQNEIELARTKAALIDFNTSKFIVDKSFFNKKELCQI